VLICVYNGAGLLACCGFLLWKVHHLQDHREGKQHADEERSGRLVDALCLLSGPDCLSRLWAAQGSHTCMPPYAFNLLHRLAGKALQPGCGVFVVWCECNL